MKSNYWDISSTDELLMDDIDITDFMTDEEIQEMIDNCANHPISQYEEKQVVYSTFDDDDYLPF